MKVQTIKDYVGVFNVATQLFQNLATAVMDEGGTLEDLRRLEDKKLCRQLAAIIVEHKELPRMNFQLCVNYAQSLSEMIAAGRYDWSNIGIIEKNFPRTKQAGIEDISLHLFRFGRPLLTDEVIHELDRAGFRPATLEELLALGARKPDLQRGFLIIALGSVWEDPYGDLTAPYLRSYGVGRQLNLGDIASIRWDNSCRFAAVRK